MVDINNPYPDAEDLREAFDREMASLRASISGLEVLFNRILQNNTYISEEEAAKILHCSVKEIPAKLSRYRPVYGRGYLFKLSDIYEFIESKKIGGK